MTLIITAAVFALVNALVLMSFYVATSESPIAARLRALTTGQDTFRPDVAAPGRAAPGFLTAVISGIGRFAFSRNERSTAKQLSAAGYRGPNALPFFLGMRTLLSFGPALAIVVPTLTGGEPLEDAFWNTVGAFAVGHFGTNLWLRGRAKARILSITHALPDSLDLMVICLEAGLGLNAAIAKVGEERGGLDDPLGREFEMVTNDLRAGRPRDEALLALGERNGVDDLRALMAMIVQSNRLGASMAATLRAHADLLRTKRRQRAEETARKLPVKILIPLAGFLLPPLFVIVIGPAFMRFAQLVEFLGSK